MGLAPQALSADVVPAICKAPTFVLIPGLTGF
ncbi:hypothetical protein BN440_0506 [Erwinia amylovora MR1]|nr:hypothetical protein BN440_0506 [Erwinia amylovora MR1]